MRLTFLSLATVALAFSSCTKVIDGPDDNTVVNNLSTARKTVMFKFTGVNCGACSAYYPIYEGFMDDNKQKVIGLHVHCGVSDTLDNSFSLWFTSAYDIPGTPRFSDGSMMLKDTTYEVASAAALVSMEEKADVGIGVTHKVVGNTLDIKVKTQTFKDLPAGSYNIVAYVVENDCWADQISIGNMQHNRILRGAANTMWGTPFTTTSKGAPVDASFTYNLGTIGVDYWNANNLEVVVVIYKMNGNTPEKIINANSTLDL